MTSPGIRTEPRFINVLRTQASSKIESRTLGSIPCPFGHPGRIFQGAQQLFDHAKAEHPSVVEGLNEVEAKLKVRDIAAKSRQSDLDIAALSLDADKKRQNSPPSGKKRRAEFELRTRRKKGSSPVDNVTIADPNHSGEILNTTYPDKPYLKPHDSRLHNQKQGSKGVTSPQQSATAVSSDQPAEVYHDPKQRQSTVQGQLNPTAPISSGPTRQAGIIELPKFDLRYPELLLQPDSRPISQEQLASEVKSIYAGLTMVETKCIQVDRAQAAASQDRNQKPTPEHWQALIALHRTLLHEHHDFFLASQHPSASPALRRLAAKYTMPARMWKHGIHSFLELLRRHLPGSLDYMLAFIYLAYQMMALLYETVPAFEDTWIECLGDLGRYRMAIEDEDIRDRETWANVARSWYTKAANRNPPVGRLYHHLAILARPNALHQLYYYARSLNSVEPFPSARDSIMTLFRPVLGRDPSNMSTTLPIDASFIKAHAYTFERDSTDKYEHARAEYISQLDSHIGRVTTKWKEQGVYTTVTNIASWFDYGNNSNILRQIFLLRAQLRINPNHMVEERDQSLPPNSDLQTPRVAEKDFKAKLSILQSDIAFQRALRLTNDTFLIVLRRVGDKNVLPFVHVMLSFFSTFASIEYVAHLLDESPWTDISAFLNTLSRLESSQTNSIPINTTICHSVFPSDSDAQDQDELPLPEDYRIQGLIWTKEYHPRNWFRREHDEEDKYLELASTVKRRADRILRLGYQLSTLNRWISYDEEKHTFAPIMVK